MNTYKVLKFQGQYFCDTQGITRIHENIVWWKFGAIQLLAENSGREYFGETIISEFLLGKLWWIYN